MKRFVGRPWIQRFQLFATGAQRRGDGDAARSTFPSGSIRRLATRSGILMKGVYFRWMFFKWTFFWNQARMKDKNMIANILHMIFVVGRLFNFQSLIFRNNTVFRRISNKIQVLGLQDKLAQGGRARPSLWKFGRFVDIQKLAFLESLTGGMDSHIFLCSLHSHSHRECCSRCPVMEFQKLKILLIYVWFVPVLSCSHFLRLGEESWNDMVCSHDHSIMLRHVLAHVAHGA